MPDSFSFEDFLAQQKADYRASLPGRLAALRQAWEAVRAGNGALPMRGGLERVAHGLAGSAATFGLAAIGDAARTLEDTLAPDTPEPPAWDAAFARQISTLVETLSSLLQAAVDAAP